MHINPYIAGNPIDEAEAFFGRDDVLRDVTAVLRNPRQNAIVLYGQRRIGKTSILLQLEKRLAADGQYTPVSFDLMDKAGKPLSDVLQELARRINQALNLPDPDLSRFDAEGAYFRDAFLPQAAQLAAPGGLVLLFDEFDVLDGPDSSQSAGQTFFPYLRAWMNRAAGAQFVFVIGRRPEDLSIHTMPTFKGVSASQVALLDQRDTEAIIRQSEEEGSLHWTDEAVTAVWEWTQGHPYFTQLLCEAVWNEAYRDEPEDPPTARLEMVEAAVKPVLNSGANAFVWLWDGLPPAERYVMAVLAGADKDAITQDELIDILNQSGVRLALGQLVVAPETLEKWGTLRQVNDGYQFAVPILRHWIQINRKLSLVKEELNRIEPEADKLFKAAQVFYDKGNLDVALQTVNFTLEINPRHNDARILLGQINLDQGQLPEAVKILEEVYDDGKYSSGRHLLITTLLRLAETQRVENDQLATYERVLMIVPEHRVAKARRQAILDARRKRELAKKQDEAAQLAAQEDWAGVIGVYEALLQEFPEEADWQAELSKAQNERRWQRQYNEAVGALETGDRAKGQRLLAAIIAEEPAYKQTARYLLQATEEIDVTDLQAQLQDAVPRPRVRQLLFAAVGSITILLAVALIIYISASLQRTNDQVATFDATLTAQGSMFEEAFEIAQDVMTRQAATIAALIAATTSSPTLTPMPIGMRLADVDGMTQVFVSAGEFTMGSEDGDSNEAPVHTVYLDAYWIDQTEVTNAQFAAFLNANGNQSEGGVTWLAIGSSYASIVESGGRFQPEAGYDDHPVVAVSWYGATAYCAWAGRRLPTEAEWEKAARGTDARTYPWGEGINCDRANYGRCVGDGGAIVGRYPAGASPYGALDMAGNVREWVADWYDRDYYQDSLTQNPQGPDTGQYKVLRGGSWFDVGYSVRATERHSNQPGNRNFYIGFRCAQE